MQKLKQHDFLVKLIDIFVLIGISVVGLLELKDTCVTITFLASSNY